MSNSDINFRAKEIITLVNSQGLPKTYRINQLLGAGQTSVVWKADELNDDGQITRTVALKVLRPESEASFREGFENEKSVLMLLASLGTVPDLFDYSSVDARPAYLAMEWVQFPSISAYVNTSSRLMPALEKISNEVWRIKTDVSLLSSDIRNSGMDEGQFRFLSELAQTLQQVERPFSDAKYFLKNYEEHQSGLDTSEVLQVGDLVCLTLDRLHKNNRSYQDFQMQNIHWDRSNQKIKILDWNVVIKTEDWALYQKDLYEFSAFLFYLITLRSYEPGDLDLQGGRKWQEAPWIFHVILQRALNLDPAQRYFDAYDPDEHLHPFSACLSLGRAFWCAHQFLTMDFDRAFTVIQGWLEENKGEDAVAACQILRKRMDIEPFLSRLEEIEKKALQISGVEGLRAAKIYLGQMEIRSAFDSLKQIEASAPKDLEVKRWLTVSQSLSDLVSSEAQRIWDKGVPDGITNLEEGNFSAAFDIFTSLGDRFKILQLDAGLNIYLMRLEEIRQEITRIADPKLWDTINRSGMKDQLDEYETIQENILKNDYAISIPYYNLIIANYPGLDEFTAQFSEFRIKVQELRNQRSVLQQKYQECSFEEILEYLRKKLHELPGNYDLLHFILEKTHENINQNHLDRAETLLVLGIDFISSSPLFREFITLRQMCLDWQLGKLMVEAGDFSNALGVFQRISHLLPDEVKRAFKQEICSDVEKVLLTRKIDWAKKWVEFEVELGDRVGDDHVVQLSQLENELKAKKEADDLERENAISRQRESLLHKVLDLSTTNTVESLQEAIGAVEEWLKTIDSK